MNGEQPIQSQYVAQMNAIAEVLDTLFNEGRKGEQREVGFCLLVFPFGEPSNGRANYICNAERADMIATMKDLIARFEGRRVETEGNT